MNLLSFPASGISRATLLASSLGLAVVGHAADQTWISANTNNDWNTTTAGTPQPNWDAGVAWTQGNTAIFGGTGETVTLTEAISAEGLTFNADNYGIAGNTLALASGAVVDTGANNATIGAAIAGGPFSKSGSGNLVLTGTNSYSGIVTVNAGTLQLANPGALPAGVSANLATSGAKLKLGVSGASLSWAAGSAVASSTHSAPYVANNTIDGSTGTRWASGGVVPQWLYADLGSVQSIGQVNVNWEAAYATAFTIQVSDDATTWTNATGTLAASGAGVKTCTLNPGTTGRYVRVNSTGAAFGGVSFWEMQASAQGSGAGTYTLASLAGVAGTTVDLLGLGSTLKVGADNSDTTYAGSMVGGGSDSLTKEGSGTLTLVGSTNYQVPPTVTGGTLKIDLTAGGSELNMPGSNVVVSAGGTLQLLSGTNTAADTTFFRNGTVTGNGTITKKGTGYIGLLYNSAGLKDFAGLIDVQEGTLANNGTAWATGAGAMDLNVASGAQFDIRTGNLKVDELTGGGLISRSWTSTATLTVGCNNGTGANFSGTLQNLRPEGSNGGILAFTKVGTGTQTLSGSCTYTGATTVTAGTLNIAGTLDSGSAVTVQTGATLGGNGTIGGIVTVQSGGTLAGTPSFTGTTVTVQSGATLTPAGGGAAGTLTVDGSLALQGALVMEVHKAGATLTSDKISGLGSVALGGTLTVSATGDSLALGDSFDLFDVAAGLSGGFSGVPVLPLLPPGLSWDTSQLLTTGTIQVVNFVGTPVFTPPAGGYAGTPSVTITSDSGSTIYYTLNGTTPTTSSPSGPSPLNIGALPANSASIVVKAFAKKAGQADSPVASATYSTVNTPTWNVDDNGLWSDASKWLHQVVPGGTGVTVDFNTTAQSGFSTVTLDSDRSVGNLIFGNVNDIDWAIDSSNSAVLTLAVPAGSPGIDVVNHTATINAQMAGSQGLTKTGAGSVMLANANAVSGPTSVTAGTLGYTGPQFVSFNASSVSVAGGSAIEFRTLADAILAAPITGAGTVLASGNGTSLRPGGNNSAFTGAFVTANSGALDFVNVSQGWSSNASYLLDGSYMRIYGSSVGQTVTIGSLAGSNTSTEIGNWQGSAVTTTLSVGSLNTDTEFAGHIRDKYQGQFSPGTMAVTKVGSGKLTLSGTCDYTGATNVTAGTLEVNGSLAAGSAVTVSSGATFAGSGTANGAVDVHNGATIAPGTGGVGTLTAGTATLGGAYPCQLDGASGDHLAVTGALTISPTASITVSLLSAPTESSYTILSYTTLNGSLPTITGVPEGYEVDTSTSGVVKLVNGTPFDSWINGFTSLTNPADKTPTADPDLDGLANIVEFVLNGNPADGTITNLPTMTASGSNMVFTFTRRDDSESLNQAVEFDADLVGVWTTAVNGTNSTIVVTENDANPDTVTVTIPKGANTRLFARLKVTP